MKEITLNAMLLQILRRKRLFALLLLIPLLLGMGFGLLRSLSTGQTGDPGEPTVQRDYQLIQFDALESLYERGLAELENSLLLNMDPAKVHYRRHTLFVDDSARVGAGGEQIQPSDEIGFFYAMHQFTPEDYSKFRNVLGDADLTEGQLDELVAQTYDTARNLLTLTAVHEDPAIADALAEYNLQRILALHQMEREADHELRLIGAESRTGVDETLLTRLNAKVDQLDQYKLKMDELRPSLLTPEEPVGATSMAALIAPMIKWGILGLAGGLALVFVTAAVLAAGSDQIDDLDSLVRDLPVPYLGLIPGSVQPLEERVIFGTQDRQAVLDQLTLRLALDPLGNGIGSLLLLPMATEISALSDELQARLPERRIRLLDRLDPATIRQMGEDDQILLVGTPQTPISTLRQTAELIRQTGASTAVLLQGTQY